MIRYIGLCLDVNILRTVKTWRATRADAVGAEDLNSFLFEDFVRDKIIEVVGGKVCHCAAIREFGLRSCRPTYLVNSSFSASERPDHIHTQ